MCRTYNINEVGKYGVIYCLTSPSGKKYVGQTWDVNNRFNNYLKMKNSVKEQPKLYNALNKYRPENFIYEIIDLCETQTEMDRKEKFYIMDVYDSMNTGYNCTDGGYGGRHSYETRQRMSKTRTGHLVTNETRQKISKIKKDMKLTGVNNKLFKRKRPQDVLEKLHTAKTWVKNFNLSKEQKSNSWKKISLSLSKHTYEIITPNGQKIIVKNLNLFCKEHNLDSGSMSKVVRNIIPHYKKWTGKILTP